MVAGHLNVPRLRQANATRACNSNMQNGKMNEVWRVQVKMKTQGNAAKCKHDSRTCVGDIRNLTANLRLKLTCKGNSECILCKRKAYAQTHKIRARTWYTRKNEIHESENSCHVCAKTHKQGSQLMSNNAASSTNHPHVNMPGLQRHTTSLVTTTAN